MIDVGRFALNRIASPQYPLRDFFALASEIGLSKVELRNDIRDGEVIDGMSPKEAARLASDNGIRIISINALQKFNLAAARDKARGELQRLLDLCGALTCPAVVLCPNNEAGDLRPRELRFAETVDSLVSFGPLFEKAGVLGYVEPLGFGISSLASLVEAQKAIANSGFSCYRTLVDTFHLHIGPENAGIFGSSYKVDLTGLVHVSGVEDNIPTSEYRDAHRILPGLRDRMQSRATARVLAENGYKGDFSLEPFSDKVQNLPRKNFVDSVLKSLQYLSE